MNWDPTTWRDACPACKGYPQVAHTCPSDGLATISELRKRLSGRRTDGFTVPERGRPDQQESDRRAREMARLVAGGKSYKEAARDARVNAWRALVLVESPDWLSLVEGLRDAA